MTTLLLPNSVNALTVEILGALSSIQNQEAKKTKRNDNQVKSSPDELLHPSQETTHLII